MYPLEISGLGVAISDDTFAAVDCTRPGRPARVTNGAVPPGDGIDGTLRGILRTFVHELPSIVGVSHHNLETVDRVDSSVGTQLVPVSPTAATLAGLPYVDSAGQYSLQPGVDHEGGLNALLKIGPHKVSYALQQDVITHRSVEVPPIIRSCDAQPYWAYLDELRRIDPVALLGNRGWRNAAEFILERSAGALPQPTILTRQLMAEAAYDPSHDGATLTEQAQARKRVRSLTSHLCHYAMQGDPFALEVAFFMGQLFGGALGQVSAQCVGVRRLYIQYNSITAVTGMTAWMTQYCGLGRYIADASLSVVFIGPKPQIAEAFGAIKLAQLLVAA